MALKKLKRSGGATAPQARPVSKMNPPPPRQPTGGRPVTHQVTMTTPGYPGMGTTPATHPAPAAAPPAPAARSATDPGIPYSTEEEAARLHAGATYDTARAGIGGQIYQAALRYGSPEALQSANQQWGSDLGPVVDNPNSQLATILRNQQQGIEQSGLSQNANNTFFSGLHLKADQNIYDQSSRERLAAQQEFENALSGYLQQLREAQDARAGVIGSTGASAIDRYLSRDPIAGADAPPPAAPPAPARPSTPAYHPPAKAGGGTKAKKTVKKKGK